MKRKLLIFAVALLCIVAALSFTVFAEEDGAPSLTIEGANLSFEDSVYTVYAVSHPEINKSDIRLLVWTAAKENPDAYLVGTENYVLSPMGAEARVNDADCTVFINDKIYAKNMADDYYVRAYAEVDGTVYYSDIVKYSVLQYAYNKLGITGTATESATLKNMLTRMLSYGAAAQLHFEHNVDRLADGVFFQIKVEGGTLADGFTKGLYLEGDTVTLTAPEKNAEGNAFRHWVNSNGEVVSTENPASLSVGTSVETYTAAYAPAIQYSEGLKYTPSDDGSYFIVSGIGTCKDTDVALPPTHAGFPVKGIGEYAFYDCSSLASITLPEGVTFIGNYAFYRCDSLASIALPESLTFIGNYAFEGCSSLTSITIPESLTSIGDYAFYWCDSLASITLPEGVTSIGNSAFSSCSSLTSISVAETNEVYRSIDGNLYTKDGKVLILYAPGKQDTSFTIPEGVTSIGDRAFYDCSSMTSIILPEGVTSIGNSAFSSCSSLTSITIPEGLTSIGEGAFQYCFSLTSISLPEGVTSIGNIAFVSCSSLTSITIPEGVTSIGEGAFAYCSALTSISLPESLTSIGERAFSGCSSLTSFSVAETNEVYQSINGNLYTKDGKTLIQYAIGKKDTTFIIPEGVTSIGKWAFDDCSSLTSITIPEGLTSIGYGAFWNCSSLTSVSVAETNKVYQSIDGNIYSKDGKVLILYAPGKQDTSFTIPEGVTSIGDEAFYLCSSLTSITLPEGVTSIGDEAFYLCSSLTSITLPESVTSIGNYAFRGCSSLTSVCYEGTAEEWDVLSANIGSSNDDLLGATRYYYSESEPTEEGWFWHYDENGEIVIWPGHSGGLLYTLSSDGTYYIVSGIGSCTDKNLVIPPTHEGLPVKEIGDGAFFNCDSLTSITLPESLTSIGDGAFYDCSSLTSVYYEGTAEEWDVLNANIGSSNDDLLNATRYYYSESEPTEEGNFWHYDENGEVVVW